jgi:hypothetical protein
MFRIIEQGWTKEEAIQEMVEGGYRFHREWINIIRYVKHVNVESIRKKLENHQGSSEHVGLTCENDALPLEAWQSPGLAPATTEGDR